MKLEMKHLIPYLPYELRIKHNTINDIFTMDGIMYYSDRVVCSELGELNEIDLGLLKPILRHLSDLNNENIVKLKLFVGADKDFLIGSPLSSCYEDIQYLLSEHFDIFGLIDSGLAIDINTLDK